MVLRIVRLVQFFFGLWKLFVCITIFFRRLVLESAWRVPEWQSMKEALAQVISLCIITFISTTVLHSCCFIWVLSSYSALQQVEVNFPESMAYKLNLYRGYIAICHPEEQHLNMVGVSELLSCFVVLRAVHIFWLGRRVTFRLCELHILFKISYLTSLLTLKCCVLDV